jgi:endonuclease YncB( thermonuclease family)
VVNHRLSKRWQLTALLALSKDAIVNPRATYALYSTRWHLLGAVLIAGVLLGFADRAQADVIVGKAIRVIDGDTILVDGPNGLRQSVRILGIDAPEAAQPYGRESRESLAQLVSVGQVRADCPKLDHRRSVVCRVWAHPTDCPTCDRTIDVGLAQVSVGMAWWYRRYELDQPPEVREHYAAAEKTARDNRRGLWAGKDPVAPWEWRRER